MVFEDHVAFLGASAKYLPRSESPESILNRKSAYKLPEFGSLFNIDLLSSRWPRKAMFYRPLRTMVCTIETFDDFPFCELTFCDMPVGQHHTVIGCYGTRLGPAVLSDGMLCCCAC